MFEMVQASLDENNGIQLNQIFFVFLHPTEVSKEELKISR